MCKDDKDIFKLLKLKFGKFNNVVKRFCFDNFGSIVVDIIFDDNL